MSEELAAQIARLGDEILGPWSIKAYVHPSPDRRGAASCDFAASVLREEAPVGNLPGLAEDAGLATRTYRRVLDSVLEATLHERSGASPGHDEAPAVVLVGMYAAEVAKVIAYVGSTSPSGGTLPGGGWRSPRWDGLWEAQNSDDLLRHLERSLIHTAAAVVLPLILPESGNQVSLPAVFHRLTEREFRGRLILDATDYFGAGSPESWNRPSGWDGDISLLCARGGLPGERSTFYTAAAARPATIGPLLEENWALGGLSLARRAEIVAALRGHRRRFLEGLQDLIPARASVWGAPDPALSGHILSIQFRATDHLMLVERLWRDHGVLATYVGPLPCIVFRLLPSHTREEVDLAVHALREELVSCNR